MAKPILVEVLGDARQFAREMDKAAGKTRQMGKVAGVVGLALAGGLAFGLEKSAKVAAEGAADQARLDTALKITHQSVEAMTPALEGAEAASRNLGFADNETRLALAKLEVATGSTKKATTDLTVAENISRLKKVDLQTATQMLTGSMAGNTRAAKALGIILMPVTRNMDALKEKYKQLGEAIPVAERAHAKLLDKMATGQAAIQQVTDKVRGQAAAFADTAQGGVAKYHAEMQRLEEVFGNMLLPALTSVALSLASVAGFLSEHTVIAKILGGAVAALAGTLLAVSVATKLYAAGQAIVTVATAAWTAAQWLLNVALDANPIGLVVIAIAALVGGLIYAWKNSETFRDIVIGTWNAIKAAAVAVFDFVRERIIVAWEAIKSTTLGTWAVIESATTATWNAIKAVTLSAWGLIRDYVVNPIRDMVTITSGLIGDIVGFFERLPGRVSAAFTGAWATVSPVIRAIFTGVMEWAGQKLDNIVSFWANLPGRIVAAVQSGAGAARDKLHDAMTSIFSVLPKFVRDALDIHSPSKEFENIGIAIMEGAIKGMKGLKAELIDAAWSAFGDAMGMVKEEAKNFASDVKGILGDLGGGYSADNLKSIVGAVKEANRIDAAHYPYVWGGGHNASFSGPYDCSGAVSAVLHKAGLLGSPQVSGALAGWGSSGAGKAITVFADAVHTFMNILGRGWGTGTENDRGGAGWLSYNGPYRTGFSTRHWPGLAEGGIVTSPVLRWVGEAGPEAVVPLTNRAAGLRMMGALSNHFFGVDENFLSGPKLPLVDDVGKLRNAAGSMISRVWTVLKNYFPQPLQPASVRFVGPPDDYFVGADEEGVIYWPDWFSNWMLHGPPRKRNEARETIIHEFAHTQQNFKHTPQPWQSEGGAEAFAQNVVAAVMQAAGVQYNGNVVPWQYPHYVARVLGAYDNDWIMRYQFAKDEIGMPAPIPMAAGGIVKSSMLATIGEKGPEAVIPLDRARLGGELHIHFDGPVFGDYAEVGKQLEPHILRAQRNANRYSTRALS